MRADRPTMHPRMNYPESQREKLNTCKPRNPNRKGPLARRQARLNARRNDHSRTLKSLPVNVNPLSYRQPGSMNQRS